MGSATTPTTVSTATMPTSMTDAEATRLGLKTYIHGVTYNNSVQLLLTGAAVSVSVQYAYFIPYQMQDGVWRLKFSIQAVGSSLANQTFTLSTVTSKVSSGHQPFTSSEQSTGTAGLRGSHVAANSSNFGQQFGAAVTQWSCWGDVALESKPSWAY